MSPQLLVSVRDMHEFQLALGTGVGWIDLKNPDRGSLGRPEPEFTNQAIQTLRNAQFREFRVSIALGELNELDSSSIDDDIAEFDFAKIALAGCDEGDSHFAKISELAGQLSAENRLILVHYADWLTARAPSFDQVLDWARQLGSQFILIDTWRKLSGNLLSFYSAKTISEMILKSHQAGICISLAGSLSVIDLIHLARYKPDVLAVRGAACTVGSRTQGICANRLRDLVQLAKMDFVDRNLCTADVRL
jgi:(5-formylfuran-3-yl)methyl phosphate synthase